MIPLSLTVLFTSEERPRAVGVRAFLINLPVVAVGLLAVTVLLPESRSATRTGLDPVGVLAAMAAGTLVLVGFGLWERRLSRRPDGQPLVDLALSGSTSFTWVLALPTWASSPCSGCCSPPPVLPGHPGTTR